MTDKRFFKIIFGFIFALLASIAVLGCASREPPLTSSPTPPPDTKIEYRDRVVEVVKEKEVVREVVREAPSETLMPFTINLMRQLQQGNVDLQKIQFILFGRISLERAYIKPTASQEGGRANINVEHVRNSITINDRLEGALLEIPEETRGGEITLSVCFEDDDNYRLKFSSRINEPASYFYLNYTLPPRDAPPDEKGTLLYGGETYELSFAGEKAPYLLIRLTQKEYDSPIPREAAGRRVGNTE